MEQTGPLAAAASPSASTRSSGKHGPSPPSVMLLAEVANASQPPSKHLHEDAKPPSPRTSPPYAGIPVLPDLGRLRDNRRDVPLTCQVVGCGESLSGHAEYYRRYRVCKRHLKGPALIVDGVPQRFCQQCGRFHQLDAFDGEKRNCRARLEEHNSRRRKVMAPGGSGSAHHLSGSRTTTRREAERQGRTTAALEKKDPRGGPSLEIGTSKGATGFAPAPRRPSALPVEGPVSTSSAGGYLEPELVMSVLQNMSSLPLRATGAAAHPAPVGGPTWPTTLRAEGGDLPGTPARSTEPLNLLQDLAVHRTSSSQSALGNLLERILSEPLRSSAAPNSASTATHLGLGPGYGETAGQNEASLSTGVNQLLSLWSSAGLPSEDLGRMLSSSGSRQLSAPSLLPQLSSILAEAAPAPQPPQPTASPNAPRQASVRLLRGPDPAAHQRSPFQVVVPGDPGSRHLVPTVPRSGLTQEGSGGSSALESAGGNGSGSGQRLDVGPFEALPNPFERRASGSQRMSSATTSTGGEPGAGPPPAKRLALARSVAFVPAPSQPAQETTQLTPEALALLPAINQLLGDLLAGQPLTGRQAQSQVTLLQDLLQQIVAPRR